MTIKNAKKNATFRIDPNILKKLRTESNQHVVSLNSLINQILTGYITWEKQASKSGWILIHKKVIKSFIEELDEKTISKIAAPLAKEVMTDTLLNMHNKVNLGDGYQLQEKDLFDLVLIFRKFTIMEK